MLMDVEMDIIDIEMLDVVPHSHSSRRENELDNSSDADTVCSEDDVVLGQGGRTPLTCRCCNDAMSCYVAMVGVALLCCIVVALCAVLSCEIPPYNNYKCTDQECYDTNYCEICGCRNETADL